VTPDGRSGSATPAQSSALPADLPKRPSRDAGGALPGQALGDLTQVAWNRTCFYSSPIGEEHSEERKHSDVLMDSLVRPAIEALDPKMRVVRSDRLSSSPITASVFEHVFRSRLVIGDLSYHNPSVLYEVGLRHASGQPCVLISRTGDRIPANLQDVRVVLVNTSELWGFMSDIEIRRQEVTDYARWALSSAGQDASPVRKLFPDYRKHFRE
jgi:hypothetical protein